MPAFTLDAREISLVLKSLGNPSIVLVVPLAIVVFGVGAELIENGRTKIDRVWRYFLKGIFFNYR